MNELQDYAKHLGLSVSPDANGFSVGRDEQFCFISKVNMEDKNGYMIIVRDMSTYVETNEEVKEILRTFMLGLPENWEMN